MSYTLSVNRTALQRGAEGCMGINKLPWSNKSIKLNVLAAKDLSSSIEMPAYSTCRRYVVFRWVWIQWGQRWLIMKYWSCSEQSDHSMHSITAVTRSAMHYTLLQWLIFCMQLNGQLQYCVHTTECMHWVPIRHESRDRDKQDLAKNKTLHVHTKAFQSNCLIYKKWIVE